MSKVCLENTDSVDVWRQKARGRSRNNKNQSATFSLLWRWGSTGGCWSALCSVATGEGGVNNRTSPRPAVTRVTLTDYSVSAALITLRRGPPCHSPAGSGASRSIPKGSHRSSSPTRSQPGCSKRRASCSERDLGDQFVHALDQALSGTRDAVSPSPWPPGSYQCPE